MTCVNNIVCLFQNKLGICYGCVTAIRSDIVISVVIALWIFKIRKCVLSNAIKDHLIWHLTRCRGFASSISKTNSVLKGKKRNFLKTFCFVFDAQTTVIFTLKFAFNFTPVLFFNKTAFLFFTKKLKCQHDYRIWIGKNKANMTKNWKHSETHFLLCWSYLILDPRALLFCAWRTTRRSRKRRFWGPEGRVVQNPIKLTQGQREFWFQFYNFLVKYSVYIVCRQFWVVVFSNYTEH